MIRREGDKIIHTYALIPCPWCGETPSFYMSLGYQGKLIETFLPKIKCYNEKCKVQPVSKHVSIRKQQRFCIPMLREKIERAIFHWNYGLSSVATQGFELCYSDLLDEIIKIRGN